MYQDLKKMFWLPGMKVDVARLVNKCWRDGEQMFSLPESKDRALEASRNAATFRDP